MLYIDSADPAAIERLLATGCFDGVTCNPAILRKAGRGFADLPALYGRSVAAGARLFFAQATGEDAASLETSARQVLALGTHARVKIMGTSLGLRLTRTLTDAGHEVLVTGITHPAQILACRAAGARWVAAYVGRAAKAGVTPTRLIGQAASAMSHTTEDDRTRILAASLHSLDEVAEAAALGAQDLTLPVDICDALLDDPATWATSAAFEADHAATSR